MSLFLHYLTGARGRKLHTGGGIGSGGTDSFPEGCANGVLFSNIAIARRSNSFYWRNPRRTNTRKHKGGRLQCCMLLIGVRPVRRPEKEHDMNTQTALLIGNSDGIGLAFTRRLLNDGWRVKGLSRSVSPVRHENYHHLVADVTSADYGTRLEEALDETPDLVVYCAGIGEAPEIDELSVHRTVFEVNLMGAVRTIEAVLPAMVAQKRGHIVVLSSLADVLTWDHAQSYPASKAALSTYVEGLGLQARSHNVAITNVRFGFVDTKMAKGDRKPLLMTTDQAVGHLMKCLRKRPIRYSRPRFVAAVVLFVRWLTRLGIAWRS